MTTKTETETETTEETQCALCRQIVDMGDPGTVKENETLYCSQDCLNIATFEESEEQTDELFLFCLVS